MKDASAPVLAAEARRFAAALEGLRGRPLAVLGHVRPDGDCVGSQVGLVRVLRARGFDAVAVNHHSVPRNLRPFLGGTPYIEDAVAVPAGRVPLAVDCGDRSRFGEKFEPKVGPVALNVDHHISNTLFGAENFVYAERAATAEILAAFFFALHWPVDAVAAQALYVGLATDTGQFRYPATTLAVFELACRLMEKGARPAVAADVLYGNEPPAKLALLQRFLASLKFAAGGKVCYGHINGDDYLETGAHRDDSEGLVEYARAIAGVEIGALLESRDARVKGSLRAKDPARRVDLLAAQFNGGGHGAAAGFNFHGPVDQLLPKLLAALEQAVA